MALTKKRRRENRLGLLFILPAAVVFFVIIAVPLFRGIMLAFYSVESFTLGTHFVGLANFAELLGDPDLYRALFLTLQYTGAGLILQIVVGVSFAMLLNQKFYGRALARSFATLPYLAPVVVSATLWKWLLDDTYGIVNYLLMSAGIIQRPIAWLADPRYAMWSSIAVEGWRVFPFVVIATLGRLQNIPRQLYDAARTDGASSWAIFWDITLPQLRSVLVITVFLRFVWNFNDYNTIALLTGGGPAGSTMTLPLLIHQLGFDTLELGMAAAVADLALVVLTMFFILYFWYAKPLEDKR